MRTIMHPKNLLVLCVALFVAGCAQQRLTKADKAFDRMAYAEAACSYEKVMARSDDRGVAVRLATSYARQNEPEKAADWFAYADRVAPLTGDDALAYGRVLQNLGRSGFAADQFAKVLSERPEDAVVRELGLAIATRDAFYEDTTLFTVRPVELAGMVSAFSAFPTTEGIVFTGETEPSGKNTNPWTGASFLDVFVSKPSATGSWSAPQKLKGEVNGRFHDGPAVISKDGRTMFFTRSDYFKFRLLKDENAISHLMLYRAEKQADGSWGAIHSFAYNGDDFSAGHAALSSDGNTLYYISDMPGGFGGTDIYACAKTADGWGYPKNLGPTVNTGANEMFPTLSGDTLYFASNGHRTLGGLDIFRTVRDSAEWSAPENLNYPINTPFDDFAFVPLPDGVNGFLSSDRNGNDRIYTFTANEPALTLAGTFKDEEDDGFLPNVEVKLRDLETEEDVTFLTGPDGKYSFPLRPEHDYRIQGGRDPMFTESRDLSTRGQRTSRTYTEDFKLRTVVIDKPIIVENIYYDYDKWDIRPDAAIELNKLARLFNDNPNLSFELGSHTDSRASDAYNLVLSDARARSAVDYLIHSGVDPNRIAAIGYGESRLVNRCSNDVECTEDEHQANRPTDFKVTKVNTAASLMGQRR